MKFYKKLSAIIPVLLLTLLCAGKDIHNSFQHYKIALVVADSSALNTAYEKPIYRMMRNAGHNVYLCDDARLTNDNAKDTTPWTDFDLAIIPNFVKCPSVDTTKKIGDIPVIILEDSLWNSFGFSKTDAALGTIVNDDSIYISSISDSITSVFSSIGDNKIYISNSTISGIDVDSLQSYNILAKDKTYANSVITIDTLNNKKRIAFGLNDVSKLRLPFNNNDRVTDNPTGFGWELFNRSIGRLVGAEQDSIFHIGYITHWYFPATLDSCTIDFLQTNMQQVEIISSEYVGNNYYDSDYKKWTNLNLIVQGTEPYYPNDSLRNIMAINDIPLIALVPGISGTSYCPDDGFFDSQEEDSLFYWIDSIDSIYITKSHPIVDSLGFSAGNFSLFATPPSNDPFYQISNKSYVLEDTTNVEVIIKAEITDSLKMKWLGYDYTNENDLNILLVRNDHPWVYLNSSFQYMLPPYDNYPWYNAYTQWPKTYFNDNYFKLLAESFYYVLNKSIVNLPSGVTVTQHGRDSLIVNWTDNSSNETGFNIYLTPGGSYSGNDTTIATVAANVESTIVGKFYPPSSLWYLDVGAYSSIGGSRSGAPDSAYTAPAQPARPIVYALSDTAINVLLNGYLWYDLFTDTTLATNPQWYEPYGKWDVERSYWRLKSNNALDSTTLVGDLGVNNLTFDGADDYAYHADSDSLDVGTEDYLISFWIKRNDSGVQERIVNKRNGTTFFDAMFDTDNKLYFTLCDGTFPAHYSAVSSNTTFTDTDWYHCVGIMDRSDSGYVFIDSAYDNSASVVSSNYDVSNSGIFYLSTFNGTTQFFDGQLVDLRFMKFGTSGLTVTGSYATNNLLIKLSIDTVYCQATNDGLVKYLYENQGETINNTDYDWFYNAQRTPVATNGTNWADANTDGLADLYGVENGSESGMAPTTQIGNGTHGFSGRYQRLIATGNGRYGMDLTAPFFADSNYYYISFKYRATKAVEVGRGAFPANTSTPSSVSIVQKGAILNTLYVAWGENYVTGDSIEIDDLVMYKVGEVAWWPFNEIGSPDTLYDSSSNNLDLITSGNPVASSGISAARANVISSTLPDSQGVQWSFKFHINDSLKLNKQWIRFYFNSSDSIGTDDGYCFYADSSLFRVYKQTNNAYVDTLIDTTWTGDYKWHTALIKQDWIQNPSYKSINYSVYLDNSLMGTFSDTTYQSQEWLVLQASHRRMWFDNMWLKNNSPGGNDTTYTQFAIIDSTSGTYLQSNHTFSSTPYWATWNQWGEEDGFYAKMSPFTSKKLRVIARCKK